MKKLYLLGDSIRMGYEPMVRNKLSGLAEVYAGMLKRVYKRIKIIFPQAKVIFALSTPIQEERFVDPERFIRYNKDIKVYNNIATQIMKECGVSINDLYAIAESFTADQYADMTHFSEEGYNILADAIVNACEPYFKD